MVGLQNLDLPIGVRLPVSQKPFYKVKGGCRKQAVRAGLNLPAAFYFLPTNMNDWHETQIRVRYAETDKMGIVHHSNYAIWFEVGRSEFCRARGFSYRELEEKEQAMLIVAEFCCRYKSSAYYEDELTVRTKISELRSRTLRFVYEIYRAADQTILAEGETLHIFTGTDKKVRSLPENYKEMLLIETVETKRSLSKDSVPG